MRGRGTAIALCRDDRLDVGLGNLLADGVCVIAFVGEQSLDPAGDHPEQGSKALRVVGLSGRQYEAERSAFRVTARMELGGEAASRSAKRLGLLSPLFMPTAQ